MSEIHNFCEKCGAKLPVDARFCEKCGHVVGDEAGAVGADTGSEVPIAGASSETGVPCPDCGSPGEPVRDAVHRLRTTPEKESPTAQELEAFVEREELVQLLSVPQEPKPFSLGSWIFLLVIPVVNLFSIFMSPLKGGLKVVVGSAAVVFVGFIIWSVTGTFDDPFGARDTTMMVGAITFGLYFLALLYSWFEQKAEIKRTLGPRYERSVPRWAHLVYCDDCGVVFFDDQAGASAKVSQTADFLAG